MSELLTGTIILAIGIIAGILAVRRYKNREGQFADIIRRVSGATKE